MLKERSVDWSRGFIDNGGDSLALVFFIAAVAKSYGIELTAQQVLGAGSLEDLRSLLAAPGRGDASSPRGGALLEAPRPQQGLVCGTVPLAANRFSYFDRRGCDFEYWVLSPALVRCHPGFDCAALQRVVEHLVAHHDGLRLQLTRAGDRWSQRIGDPSELQHFVRLPFPGEGNSEQFVAFIEDTIERMYHGFTFPGALFKVLVVTPAAGSPVVAVIAHHIALDAFAIGIMLRDLNALYRQATTGQPLQLPAKTTSYIGYVQYSTDYWSARADMLEFWRALPWHEVRDVPLRGSFAAAKNREQHTACSVARTRALSRADLVGEGADVSPDLLPMLLAAMTRAYGEWTSHQVVLISVLFHGRENFVPGISLSRTVGYVCDFVPLLLRSGPSLLEIWHAARQQVALVRVGGKSYGVYRHLSRDERVREEFLQHPQSQISLNVIPPQMRHAGECDFGATTQDFRRPPGTKETTQRAFALSGGVYYAEEHFCIAWDYSSLLLDKETIDQFAAACMEHFLALREELRKREVRAGAAGGDDRR